MTIDKDIVLIQHILDAISAIEAFIINIDVVHFIESDLIASAVMKKFEIIGEASNKLSDDLKKRTCRYSLVKNYWNEKYFNS